MQAARPVDLTTPMAAAKNGATWPDREKTMTVERKPVAFGDLRGWMQALDARRRAARRSTPRSIGTSSSAPSCGWRRVPAPARRCCSTTSRTTTPNARCRRVFGCALDELPPHRHDARACRPTPIRASWSRSAAPSSTGSDPAEDRHDRAGEGEHRQGRRRRSLRIPGAAMEPRSTAAAISSPTAASSPRTPRPAS